MTLPDDKTYSRAVHLYKTRAGHKQAVTDYGEDSIPARAWYGRLLYFLKMVPQRNSTSVESIAWHRASGAQPGYWNRTQRKKRGKQIT